VETMPLETSYAQECQDLLDYAFYRIDHCPYEDEKPTCAKCPIHCYRPTMREEIRQVMRYAGPRMLLHHPILTLQHLSDSMRKAPERHLRF
jgi:aldehyde:ferredoxin oxidoreductase